MKKEEEKERKRKKLHIKRRSWSRDGGSTVEVGRRMEEAGGTPENEDGIMHQQPHYDDQEYGEQRTRSADDRPPGSGGGQGA